MAGLTAARTLAAGGAKTVVLEARDRVGGRTFSQIVGGKVVDLGGQYLGVGQSRLTRLVRELGVPTTPTFHSGTKVLELCGRRSTYTGAVPSLPPLSLLELQVAITRIERARKQVPPAAPWSARRAAQWDAHSSRGLVQPLHVQPPGAASAGRGKSSRVCDFTLRQADCEHPAGVAASGNQHPCHRAFSARKPEWFVAP